MDKEIIDIVYKTVDYLERRKSKNHFQIMHILIDHGLDVETMLAHGNEVTRLFYELLEERCIYYTNMDIGKSLPYPWLARLVLTKYDNSDSIVYIHNNGDIQRLTHYQAMELERMKYYE